MDRTWDSISVSAVAYLVTTLAVYGTIVVVYRLFFHPLAQYPGPFLARISSWYDCYHAAKGDRHLDQLRCHDKYGPIVRYGPNFLLFNTAAGLHGIYGGARNVAIRKGPAYAFLHNQGATSIHSTIDKEAHSRKRRVLSHAFSEGALRALEEHVIENVDSWCASLDAQETWSSPKDLSDWATYLSFDVLGDLCFGKPFGLIRSTALRYVPTMMMGRSKMFHVVANSPILPWWRLIHDTLALDKYVVPNTYRDLVSFQAFAGRAMKERLAMSEAEDKTNDATIRKDFFYWLTRAKDPETGQGYSMGEMWSESILLITAGSDTTAVTLAASVHYLVRHPTVLARVRDELGATFTSIDEICTPQVNACQYLRAAIDESLRLNPPVPSSLQRELIQDAQIDGHWLPAGTLVGTSAWAIHRNPLYFDRPKEFRPERWLKDETAEEDVARARSAFCPFSLGARGCIGKSMAYAELSIALGRLLYQFDVRLKEGDRTGTGPDGEFRLVDQFVSQRHGPWVELRRRK